MPDANRNENILINHLAQTKSLSIDRIKLESHSFLLCFGHRVDMSKGRKVAVMRRTKRHHVINGNRESFSSFLFSFPPRESFEQRFNTASLRVSSPRKKEISRLDESVEEKNDRISFSRKFCRDSLPEPEPRRENWAAECGIRRYIRTNISRLFPSSSSSPLELPPQVSLLLQSLSFEDEPNGGREREDYGSSGRAES